MHHTEFGHISNNDEKSKIVFSVSENPHLQLEGKRFLLRPESSSNKHMSLRLWVVEIWCVEQGAGFVQFVTIMGSGFGNVGVHGTCCMGQHPTRLEHVQHINLRTLKQTRLLKICTP